MTLGASYSHFIPDAKSLFRNNGQPLVVGKFVSVPLELARLTAQWRKDGLGRNEELPVWVHVEKSYFSAEKATFCFSLEADVSPLFPTPSTIAIYEYTKDAVNPFEVILYPSILQNHCRYATHLRLVMNPTPGADGIQFSAFPRGDVARM